MAIQDTSRRTSAPPSDDRPYGNTQTIPRPAPEVDAGGGELDIGALLHPTESSRLILAVAASVITLGVFALIAVSAGGFVMLIWFGAFLLLLAGTIWLGLQMSRSRLLGSAVQVSEATLPGLESILRNVTTRLEYHKPVDVYVLDRVSGGSSTTSYLGTRIILLEGDLVAELLNNESDAELTYLIGRHIGALKAKHQRLGFIIAIYSAVDSIKIMQLFLAPYFRATVKSGDQIGAACCGDLRSAAGMMNRLMVGKDLGPMLVTRGILDQAASVRRRRLPRLMQLFQSEPFPTERYLSLLAFMARTDPQQLNEWRGALDPEAAERLDIALRSVPNREAGARPPSLGLVSAAAIVVVGALVLAGVVLLPSKSGTATPTPSPFVPPVPTTAPTTPEISPSGTFDASSLANVAPAAFAYTCAAESIPGPSWGANADAEIACHPAGSGTPDNVNYVRYSTVDAMNAEFATLTRSMTTVSDCTSVPGVESYSVSSAQAGRLGCYTTSDGSTAFLWTDDALQILSEASSPNMTYGELQAWWASDSGPEH